MCEISLQGLKNFSWWCCLKLITKLACVQEIHNTVFMSQELARRCLWLYRVCAPTASQPQEPPSPGETELRRRLEALHKDLKVG